MYFIYFYIQRHVNLQCYTRQCLSFSLIFSLIVFLFFLPLNLGIFQVCFCQTYGSVAQLVCLSTENSEIGDNV